MKFRAMVFSMFQLQCKQSRADQIRFFLIGFTCCGVDVVSEVEVVIIVETSTEILSFV